MGTSEKTEVVRKLIPETWKEAHDGLWSEFFEEPDCKVPIDIEAFRYHDASALTTVNLIELRAEHLKLTMNGNESEICKGLQRIIDESDGVLLATAFKDGYHSGRADKGISAAEDTAHNYQKMTRILYILLSKQEAWLRVLRKTQQANPDEILDQMINEMGE